MRSPDMRVEFDRILIITPAGGNYYAYTLVIMIGITISIRNISPAGANDY